MLSTYQVYQAGFAAGFGLARATTGAGSGRPNANGDPADYTYGNLAVNIGTVRSPGMNNVDGTLAKDFRISETIRTQFRFSMFNLINHPIFGVPSTSFGNANFGYISSQANQGRQLELGLKFLF